MPFRSRSGESKVITDRRGNDVDFLCEILLKVKWHETSLGSGLPIRVQDNLGGNW